MSISKVATTSENIGQENLDKLRAVFPQFVKDGEIDFDALKVFFDESGKLAGEEKYGLNWAGKSNAFRAIRNPATGTLVPQPEQSVNWDTTENIFIEGDNLEVLKLLQKHYREKVKMIYIDPPYNTGKDFIYKDNFTESVSDYYERTGQSKNGIKMTANLESNGRYHSDWLTMMYPRLFLARDL
jgi:adenine-specific DNA-methyltransferase